MTQQSPLVTLAWDTLKALVTDEPLPSVRELPNNLPDQAGCFVSIHTQPHHELRGCIGTIAPTCPTLCEEVIQNTVSAASEDPRFSAIEADELDGLVINVDVLQPAIPATVSDLDPKRFGVIVTQGHHRGLLLPDLEGVDTVDQQLDIACRKASIDPGSNYEIERFIVDRYE